MKNAICALLKPGLLNFILSGPKEFQVGPILIDEYFCLC